MSTEKPPFQNSTNPLRRNNEARGGRWLRLLRLRYVVPLAASLLAAASAVAQKPETQEALIRRYPFDPACPFGRVNNGKGMIVRCLSEEEAQQLLRKTPVTPTEPSAPPPGAGTAGAGSAPDDSSGEPAESLEVTVGPIVADQGELSLGKLAQPKDRYARCVLDHGGLKDKSGEVHVRFLVRTKGIAEGVSVHKRANVSAEAARCVADIVDRRRVGTPDAPLVGATVTVKFGRLGR